MKIVDEFPNLFSKYYFNIYAKNEFHSLIKYNMLNLRNKTFLDLIGQKGIKGIIYS